MIRVHQSHVGARSLYGRLRGAVRDVLPSIGCLLAFGFGALFASAADASITRCVGPDGRVSYQDSSCPNGARGMPVDTTPNQGFEFATREQIARARRRDAERVPPPKLVEPRPRAAKIREAQNAGERRFIQSGISVDEVRRRIGSPDRITRPSNGAPRSTKDARQQWIYHPATDDPQTTTVLTVRRGVVTQVERRVTY